MSEAKFKIGDRVKTASMPQIEGEVADALYSGSTGWTYMVKVKDHGYFLPESDLEMVVQQKDYRMTVEIDIAQNVVIASLFEKNGDTLRPLAKGHGHLIHEGEIGIAQAASYACKRLYESLGGTLVKGGSWR